jgi:DNA polymerase III subunit alpha
LCCRNDARKLNRRALEALIKAGALDCMGVSRRGLASIASHAIQISEQQAKAAAVGQSDMFGLGEESPATGTVDAETWQRAAAMEEWPDKELLTWEKETLGLYLSGHPIDRYDTEISGLSTCRLADLKPGKARRIVGLIVSVRMVKSRRGQMAIVTLDDKTARAEVTIFSKVLEECLDRIVVDRVCVIIGDCAVDEFSGEHSIKADKVLGLDDARNEYASSLLISLDSTFENGKLAELKRTLSSYSPGGCPVTVEYANACARARLRLSDEWRVAVSDSLLEHFAQQFGDNTARIEY